MKHSELIAIHNGLTMQHNVLTGIHSGLTMKHNALTTRHNGLKIIVTRCIDNEIQCIYKALTMSCSTFSYAGFFANRVTYIVLSSSKPLFKQGNPFRIVCITIWLNWNGYALVQID